MEDHFWPSIYPGIIVGLLIGLSELTLFSTFLGGIGGLLGAFLAFNFMTFLDIGSGIVSVISVVGGAIVFAKLCLKLGSNIKRNIF